VQEWECNYFFLVWHVFKLSGDIMVLLGGVKLNYI